MKAVGFKKYGGPEVLEMMEIEDPTPNDNEVVIATMYTSINRLDTLVRNGYHGLKLNMPHIPGTDVVGKIVSIGKSVSNFSIGDRVIANTVFGCGKCNYCISRNDHLCSKWNVIGMHVNGSYGDLVRVPVSTLVPAPTNYTDIELSTMPLSLPTCWRAISSVGKAENGQTIIINGASGNIGIFSILLSKALGLKSIALTRDPKKVDILKRLGASDVLIYATDDQILKDVMNATDNIGAEIVIDVLGSTLGNSIKMARNNGKIIVLGTISGISSEVDIRSLYLKTVSVYGIHNASKDDLRKSLDFISAHNIKPIISNVISLENASEAHRNFESSNVFGKIVLKH